MSVPTYLPVLPYDDVRVCCVLCSGVVSGKVCKGAKCVLFRVSRAYAVLPAPSCRHGLYVFGRFWIVCRYAGQNAYVFCVNFAASICTPPLMPFYHSDVFLSSFCFPLLCNNRAILSKVADLLGFLI